eukprot:3037383-Amphidinium_carterae.1
MRCNSSPGRRTAQSKGCMVQVFDSFPLQDNIIHQKFALTSQRRRHRFCVLSHVQKLDRGLSQRSWCHACFLANEYVGAVLAQHRKLLSAAGAPSHRQFVEPVSGRTRERQERSAALNMFSNPPLPMNLLTPMSVNPSSFEP